MIAAVVLLAVIALGVVWLPAAALVPVWGAWAWRREVTA